MDSGNSIKIGESDFSKYISERLNPKRMHLIICRKGFAIFSFNQKKRPVMAGCLLLISSDLITTVIQASKEFHADYLDIDNTIVQEATLAVNPDLISALYINPIIRLDKVQFVHLQHWFGLLKWSLSQSNPNKETQIVRNSLQSLFFTLESLYPFEKYTDIKGLSSQNKLFFDFCILICEKCHKEHGVQYYADMLHITPYYLSRITARMANSTPKRMIDEQLIAEIKHILLHTEQTISEIAAKLHFDSASYFCKFFKRNTGKSPADYRQAHN